MNYTWSNEPTLAGWIHLIGEHLSRNRLGKHGSQRGLISIPLGCGTFASLSLAP